MQRYDEAFLLEILNKAALFSGLETAVLRAALQHAHTHHFPRQSYFFHQGEAAETFYILLEGRARLTQLTPEGHQVTIRYVGPGDAIGIIVALSNTTYPISTEAITDCTTLAWHANTITKLMEQYPRLAINALKLVAGRFIQLQKQYQELATERVEQRVARALLRLIRQTGKRTESGIIIDMPLSRQDLAEMTGTTLYTVSRILSQWEQQGIIEAGRQQVIIHHPHSLVKIADDLPR
ncbi:MAG: Crp/Fnr family transcriptional regulator [Chloroflexi bacterium]|nr:MAG: Crp/Fnr family transcriptional regulator [Chloroflexota bacterium]